MGSFRNVPIDCDIWSGRAALLRFAPGEACSQACCSVLAVFVLWVGPEVLFPGYHHFWLFSNSMTGASVSTAVPANHADPLFLTFRILVSVVAVPILEELFWRGWLMRWLIDRDFIALSARRV